MEEGWKKEEENGQLMMNKTEVMTGWKRRDLKKDNRSEDEEVKKDRWWKHRKGVDEKLKSV